MFALLGPNGAGKTTTLEVLEGHRRRSGGQVSVLGVDPQIGGRDFRERIGIVLQSGGIDPELTVREVLALYGGCYPSPLPVGDVIALVGLEDKRRARVKTLSGGQRRRLDLALALVGDPDLIFLDEPTTGFDPAARHAAWRLVESLRGLGRTIVLTSHYMDEVQHLADRAVVLARGRVVAEGSPDSLGGSRPRETVISFRLSDPLAIDQLPDELPIPCQRRLVRTSSRRTRSGERSTRTRLASRPPGKWSRSTRQSGRRARTRRSRSGWTRRWPGTPSSPPARWGWASAPRSRRSCVSTPASDRRRATGCICITSASRGGRAVALPSGQGQRLQSDMRRFLDDARRELSAAFESDTYTRRPRARRGEARAMGTDARGGTKRARGLKNERRATRSARLSPCRRPNPRG